MRKLLTILIFVLYTINSMAKTKSESSTEIILPDLSTWILTKRSDRFDCYTRNLKDTTNKCKLDTIQLPYVDFYEKFIGERKLEILHNEQYYQLDFQYTYVVCHNANTNIKQTIVTDIIQYNFQCLKDTQISLDATYALKYKSWNLILSDALISSTPKQDSLKKILKEYILQSNKYSEKRTTINNRTINYDIASYHRSRIKFSIGLNYTPGWGF